MLHHGRHHRFPQRQMAAELIIRFKTAQREPRIQKHHALLLPIVELTLRTPIETQLFRLDILDHGFPSGVAIDVAPIIRFGKGGRLDDAAKTERNEVPFFRPHVEITLLSNLISMTPGSLAIDVADDRSVIYVHSMFVDDPDELRRAIKDDLERRVLELLR